MKARILRAKNCSTWSNFLGLCGFRDDAGLQNPLFLVAFKTSGDGLPAARCPRVLRGYHGAARVST